MKIWYLTSEFLPDFGGGISTYIDQVSRMFALAGHEVTVFVRDNEKDAVEYPLPHLRIVRFKHMQGECYSLLGYWAALSYQIASVVLEYIDKDGNCPEIIEVQEYSALGYYLLQRKWLKDPRLKDVSIVVHLHTPLFELTKINQSARYKFPDYWIGQMEKFCLKAASGIVAPSNFLKERLHKYCENNLIEVIPLPYEIEEGNIVVQNGYSTDFLYVGRLEYRKGVMQLLKAVSSVWDRGELFTLTMVGGDVFFEPKNKTIGEILKEKYSNYIEQNLLIFKGNMPPEQLKREVLGARVVVIPSLYENYPYSCIESMKLGRPVLVSSSGGQTEMVSDDGVNGFIFDWNINGDLVKQIYRILSLDNRQLEMIGSHAKERINRLCNWQNNLKQRLTHYENLIMGHKETRIFPVSDSIEGCKHKAEVSGENSLLSIIIPFYNLGSYLPETVSRALASTYRPREIIVVNDGSTETKSITVLKEIEHEGNKEIRIINIPNGGLANARNVGAKEAKGEFIAFLDSDDLVEKEYYEKAIEILKSYDNISFVYSWVRYFGATDGGWPTFNTEFPYLLAMNMLSAFAVVRRDDFLKYGVNRTIMEYGMEDYDGWVSMCSAGLAGVSIPEFMVRYRVRQDSMLHQFNPATFLYQFDCMSDGHGDLYSKYGLELFNLLLANGPSYNWYNPSVSQSNNGNLRKNNDISFIKSHNAELRRILNSRLGYWLIKIVFKTKLNKLF